jgi:hypothetical protein
MNSSKKQGQTGPRSIEGKRIASMNSLKNGVFAKTPVLPFEDERVYKRHLNDMMASLNPQDALQAQIAQQIADSMWRGNRQEVRAVVQREDIFKDMTPSIMAGMLELTEEQIEHAPDFLVTPNYRFGKKDLEEARKLKDQYQHLSTNVKGIANYNMIWRTYPEFFVELGKWMELFITPELMMSNNQGLNIAWQQSPKKLEEYIHRYGIYLWFVINFENMRADIRNWGAIWYFLNGRHSRQVEICDEAVMKERRICQSLLDTYYKMRKSQVEFAMMRHTELVVQKPQAFDVVAKAMEESALRRAL